MTTYRFEWDPRKASANLRKHRVSFEEAATVFEDRGHMRRYDLAHSGVEDREIVVGFSSRLRVLTVVVYEREAQCIRVISARWATQAEAEAYFAEA
jgi:hypothetical protein